MSAVIIQTSTSTSSHTHKLFDLLAKADTVYVDALVADSVETGQFWGDEIPMVRVSCVGAEDYHFEDQEVKLQPHGTVIARVRHQSPDAKASYVRLLLAVDRPLTLADLGACPLEALKALHKSSWLEADPSDTDELAAAKTLARTAIGA